MGLFHEIKKAGKKFDNWVNKDLGGWGNVATSAGILLAGVATGGIASAAGYGALASVGALGAGVAGATGYGISGAEAYRALNAAHLACKYRADREDSEYANPGDCHLYTHCHGHFFTLEPLGNSL